MWWVSIELPVGRCRAHVLACAGLLMRLRSVQEHDFLLVLTTEEDGHNSGKVRETVAADEWGRAAAQAYGETRARCRELCAREPGGACLGREQCWQLRRP